LLWKVAETSTSTFGPHTTTVTELRQEARREVQYWPGAIPDWLTPNAWNPGVDTPTASDCDASSASGS